MTRDWPLFRQRTLLSLKHTALATLVVPCFHFIMDPVISRPGYYHGLLMTFRIGAQIALFAWACNALLYLALFLKRSPRYLTLKESLPFQLTWGLSIMLIAMGFCAWAEPRISGTQMGIQGFGTGALIGAITFLLTLAFVAYRRAQQTNLKLRAESAEAQLHVLKNQMQPHFLFNSLNTLSELIDAQKSNAAEATQNLADLYREILASSQRPTSAVKNEISIVKKYLEMERLRFGKRLNYRLQVSPDLTNYPLPSLVLQTLIENAVKYGVNPSPTGAQIEVKIERENGICHVLVRNTLDPRHVHHSQGLGTGLANTKARLDLLYGQAHRFHFEIDDQAASARFFVPETSHGV